MNAQKESLMKTFRVHASSRKPTKKVCNENERKNSGANNIFDGRKESIRRVRNWISNDFRSTILDTLKILFV